MISTSGNVFCELDIIIGVWWVYLGTLEIERAEAVFLDLCADFRSFVGSLG